MCVRRGCQRDSVHRRLCADHYRQEHPDKIVREYRFRWSLVEIVEGVVRAESKDEAFAKVRKGIVASERQRPYPTPKEIELVGVRECLEKSQD